MPRNAQDVAVAGCLIERRLVLAPQLMALDGPPGTLARRVIEAGLVPAALVTVIIRELGAGQFVCPGCGKAIPFSGLGKLNSLVCPGCGEELEFRAAEEAVPVAGVPERVGPYRVLSELGRGGMGVVYRGQSQAGEQVAVKVLLGRRKNEGGSERFRNEASVARRLEHPGIVPVLDEGVHGGRPYYVMPYVPGPTLAERLREGPFPPEQAAALLRALAEAVGNAHDAGVIHRDLKPGNIILEEGTGAPRITDFGLARDLKRSMSMTRSGEVLGTPHYMAPEQMEDAKRVGTSADVYALGVILYECLTGVRPFEANALLDLYNQIMRGRPVPPRSLEPAIPASIERACLSALERRAADRPFDARAFAAAIALETEEEAPPRSAPTRRRAVSLAAAGLGLLLLAGALLAVAVARRRALPGPDVGQVSSSTPAQAGLEAALAEVNALHLRIAPYPQIRARLAAAAPLAKTATERSRLARAELELAFRRLQIDDALALARRPQLLGRAALEGKLLAGLLAWRQGRRLEAVAQLEALGRSDRSSVGATAAAFASHLQRSPRGPDPALVKAALALEPDAPLARLLAFYDRMLGKKDLDAAEPIIEELIAEAPDHWLYLWASVTLAQKRHGHAAAVGKLNTLIAAVQPYPFPEAVLIRSRLQIELGDDNAALAGLNLVIAHPDFRDNVRARVLRGTLRGRRRNARGRQEDFVHAALHDPPAFLECIGLDQQARVLPIVLAGLSWRGVDALSPGMKATLIRRVARVPEPAREALAAATGAMMRGSSWNPTVGEALKRATAAAPRSFALALQVAEVCLGREQVGPTGRALQASKRLAKSPAELREVALLEARWLARRGDMFEASAAYQRLAADRSADEGRLAAAALTSPGSGDLDQAQAQVALVLRRDPHHLTALAFRAWLALKQRRLLEALRWVQAGIEAGGAVDQQLLVTQALALRGIYASLGRFKAGRRELKETLALGGAWLREVAASALVSDPRAQPQDLVWARAALRAGLKREPRRASSHHLLGLVSIAQGRPLPESLAHLERAKQLEPRLTFPTLAASLKRHYPGRRGEYQERLERLRRPPNE